MASASVPAPMFDTIQLNADRSNIQLKESAIAGKSTKTTPILCAAGEKVELCKRTDGSVKTVVDEASKTSFTLVRKVGEKNCGFIQTQYLAQAGAALRAAGAQGRASGAAAAAAVPAAVSHVPLVAAAADRSVFSVADLDKLNNPPFLIEGDQTSAILVMVHTTSQTGAQILDKEGTPNPSGLYYPNGSELRLVESRVSGTETGQAGTATSTLLVQIDDDGNGDGWLPMGCLLRTTRRNEFDIDGFWRTALAAEAPQDVVNSAGEILGTVAEAYDAYSRNKGAGFDFGKYGKDYELFRNEYMPHILRPNGPFVPRVRREMGERGRGGTRRRKCKKGKCNRKKSRASRSSSRASQQLHRRRHSRHSRHSRHHRRR
jgi:hypothetical protein